MDGQEEKGSILYALQARVENGRKKVANGLVAAMKFFSGQDPSEVLQLMGRSERRGNATVHHEKATR